MYEPSYLLNQMLKGDNDLRNWFSIQFVNNKRDNYRNLITNLADKNSEEIKIVLQCYINKRKEDIVKYYQVQLVSNNSLENGDLYSGLNHTYLINSLTSNYSISHSSFQDLSSSHSSSIISK